MDFKVKRVDKDLEEWDIFNGETKVGRIESSRRSYIRGGSRKTLYVGDTQKDVGEIQNQKEAVQKLQDFFEQNKREIAGLERLMAEVEEGMQALESSYCKKVLEADYRNLENKKAKLQELDLV
ncbi:hypothetical protein [Bacillus thuringiensis]|uniref:hypothetical protein n=1 Tax=Bacillus thuringiensis TaxID=1428 RepID=UPI000BFB668E|nr:hypothetical protein [Bacillus thuringiensis]PGT89982.1 hypothetical protein COD17_09540 [Bacillus thuringiensis]